MKHVIVSLLLLTALFTAGCSRTKLTPQDQVHMGGANFVQITATVKAGQPVKYIVDSDGATHILVVGTDGQMVPNSDAPAQLNTDTGITVNPGQETDVTFPTAGTFTITCKIHPAMLMTVTVTA